MNRWLSIALVAALLCAILPGSALAEADGMTAIEEQLVEGLPASMPEDPEPATPVGEEIAFMPEGPSAETPAELASQNSFSYGRTLADDVPLYEAAQSADAFASLGVGSTVLIIGPEASGRLPLACYTERGLLTGWTDAAQVAVLSAGEAAAHLDAIAACEQVALYEGNLDYPLSMLPCAFFDASAAPEPEAETTEPQLQADAEPTDAPAESEAEAVPADAPVEPEADTAPAPEANAEPADTPAEPEADTAPTDAPLEPMTDAEPATAADESARLVMAPSASSFFLSAAEARLAVGRSCAIQALDASGTPIPSDAVAFESADGAVAAVDAEGVVTALGPGTTAIRVTCNGEALDFALHVPAEPTGLQLNASSLSIGVKETCASLSVSLIPEDSAAVIAWRSSNSKVVKVNAATGEITGVKTGSAYVYAKTRNGVETRCKVTVKKAPSKLSVSPGTAALGAGMTAQLKVSLPKKTASAGITYASSDPNVATVSDTGLVTAVGPGAATISARTFNGKTASCKVTVTGAPAWVAAGADPLLIAAGQKLTPSVTAMAADGSATLAEFTYYILESSDDPGCIEVNPATGEITGVRRGQAVVGIKTHNGADGVFAVNVTAAPASIQLNAASVTVGVKERYAGLSVALIPPEGELTCTAAVAWRSSNSKVVKVNAATGEITGAKAGSAYVYAKTHNGLEVRCKVTVKKAPSKLSVSPGTLALAAGGMTAQLKTSLPKKTASGAISFTSSDPGVATVSDTGLVTAVSPGTATISARTFNGKTASCKVTVSPAPSRAEFKETALSIAAGQKATASVSLFAEDGSAALGSLTYAVYGGSADPDCIEVNPATGEITGVRRGQAVVVVAAHNGVEAACSVTVTATPAGIQLNAASVTVGAKEVFTELAALLTPPEGELTCAAAVAWRSSNSKVVKVNAATGEITGVKAGSAYVYAKTHNGLEARCKVTVKKAPSKISLSPATATLETGQTGKYKVSFSGGTGGGYTFASSDPSVATVDANGVVTALATGSTTITVQTYNGKTAKSTLLVKNPPQINIPSDMPMPVASTTDRYSADMTNAEKLEYVIYVAQNKLGKPYVYGAFGPDKFDCSGFTTYCFRQINLELKHSAYTQGYDTSYAQINDVADLKRGDLVFFDTVSDSDLSDHSGIYLGNGYFIHASSGSGKVIVSTLASGYYSRVYCWGRRILD